MCTHPFAKEALTLHLLARSEGHERYFGCNLMHRNVLASSHQHLMAEAPIFELHTRADEPCQTDLRPTDDVRVLFAPSLAVTHHTFQPPQ